jgi:hypothetical protein
MVKSFISIYIYIYIIETKLEMETISLNLPNILNRLWQGIDFLFNTISIVYTLLTTNIDFIKLEGAN